MAEKPQELQINVPPDQVAGSYSNVVGVWHTQHEFAIDFCVNQPYAGGPGQVAAQVVSRVRIPPTIVFDLLRALNENLGQYESSYGPIKIFDEDEGGDE